MRFVAFSVTIQLKNENNDKQQKHTHFFILATVLTMLTTSLFAEGKKAIPSPFVSERSRYAPIADTSNLRICPTS